MSVITEERVEALAPPLSREEIANTITHGLGCLLAIVGTIHLLTVGRVAESWPHLLGCFVFGLCMVLVYAASTLYHAARTPRTKDLFRLLDHVCIYLMIAGTYTPFALVVVPSPWNMLLLAGAWLMAALGIMRRIRSSDQLDRVGYLNYLVCGWLAILAAKPIVDVAPLGGCLLVLAGGLFYTVGVFFVCRNRPFDHVIWHFFVLAGSACHYGAVLWYVAPVQ
jgi:hemolysin III